MRVLVGCEFSGTVRDAFAALGHDAWSCDLLPSETPGNHFQCDLRLVLGRGWDLFIGHPPCTHLAVSGARHFYRKGNAQAEALDFVRALMAAPIHRIALENPVSVISSKIRKPDQIIQPYEFGHDERKTTCLWLKNLPPLVPTNVLQGLFVCRVHRLPRTKDRWKLRSKTFQGIAQAMAEQWGKLGTGRANGWAGGFCPDCYNEGQSYQDHVLTYCDCPLGRALAQTMKRLTKPDYVQLGLAFECGVAQ